MKSEYSLKQLNYFLFGIPITFILVNLTAIFAFIAVKTTSIPFSDQNMLYTLFGINIILSSIVFVIAILMNPINSYAKSSFLLALLFWLPALNIFTSVLALIFGILSIKDTKKKNQPGLMLGLAAIIIASITLILSIAGNLAYSFFPNYFN